jgi:hypothetical protein
MYTHGRTTFHFDFNIPVRVRRLTKVVPGNIPLKRPTCPKAACTFPARFNSNWTPPFGLIW